MFVLIQRNSKGDNSIIQDHHKDINTTKIDKNIRKNHIDMDVDLLLMENVKFVNKIFNFLQESALN